MRRLRSALLFQFMQARPATTIALHARRERGNPSSTAIHRETGAPQKLTQCVTLAGPRARACLCQPGKKLSRQRDSFGRVAEDAGGKAKKEPGRVRASHGADPHAETRTRNIKGRGQEENQANAMHTLRAGRMKGVGSWAVRPVSQPAEGAVAQARSEATPTRRLYVSAQVSKPPQA